MINNMNFKKSLGVLLALSLVGCNINPRDPGSAFSDAARRFDAGGVIEAGGQVYNVGDYTTIEIPSDTLFDVNSADFLPGAFAILDSAVVVFKRSPSFNIVISGNMSGFGTSRFEHQLSEDRAHQVASFFWTKGVVGSKESSVTSRKLTYVGYGNYFPIANTYSNRGIRENSRIQITVYPSKDQPVLDKKQRDFNNIGSLNEAELTPSTAADSAFPSNRKIQTEFKETEKKTPLAGTATVPVLPMAGPDADPFPLYDSVPAVHH